MLSLVALLETAPWMPGTQLYTPGIHRADTKGKGYINSSAIQQDDDSLI